jgi:hypothetical protein
MTRILRNGPLFALVSLLAVSSYGQDRSVWRTAGDVHEGSRGSIVGTVSDTNEASNEIDLTPDDASSSIAVLGDTVSTVYTGFGGMINGKAEIFSGSRGFANVRVGDRIEVRGSGRGTGTIIAEQVSLLGRSVAASQVGVGDTRSPGNISTPTTIPSNSSTTNRTSRIDGIVRQVNGADNRVVVETDRRQMLTVRGSSTTPVYYRNQPYRIRDLETGDRIRIDADTTGGTTGGSTNEIVARSIEVVQSVQERSGAGTTTGSNGNQVTTISGRVTSVDRSADTVRIDNGRGEVVVDLAAAADPSGRRLRATDLQAGDQVDITGAYSSASDVFVGSTIRFVDQSLTAGSGTRSATLAPGYVTIYGTITQSLRNAPQLTIRDSSSGASQRIYVLEDFVIRTKTNTYSTADRLNENDSVVVKAYRDADGNLIGQTIRVR